MTEEQLRAPSADSKVGELFSLFIENPGAIIHFPSGRYSSNRVGLMVEYLRNMYLLDIRAFPSEKKKGGSTYCLVGLIGSDKYHDYFYQTWGKEII